MFTAIITPGADAAAGKWSPLWASPRRRWAMLIPAGKAAAGQRNGADMRFYASFSPLRRLSLPSGECAGFFVFHRLLYLLWAARTCWNRP